MEFVSEDQLMSVSCQRTELDLRVCGSDPAMNNVLVSIEQTFKQLN